MLEVILLERAWLLSLRCAFLHRRKSIFQLFFFHSKRGKFEFLLFFLTKTTIFLLSLQNLKFIQDFHNPYSLPSPHDIPQFVMLFQRNHILCEFALSLPSTRTQCLYFHLRKEKKNLNN